MKKLLLPALILGFAAMFSASVNAQGPGTIRWQFATLDEIHSSPAVAPDGTIYFGSWDTRLYALNPDGSKKWEFLANNRINSSPAIGPDGTIYVGSDDDNLYAIGPDGQKRWEFPTGNQIISDPAVALDGTIYVVSGDGHLYALNSNGSQKWQFPTGGSVPSPTVASDGTIYVASTTGFLYALNPDGSVRWKYQSAAHPATPISSCIIDAQGTIIVNPASFVGYFEALRPGGTLALSIGNHFSTLFLVIGDGGVMYGGSAGNLLALFSDGNVKWKFPFTSLANRGISGAPAIAADGTVYFGAVGGTVFAVDMNGKEKWEATAGGLNFSSPAIGSDGTVYIGSDNKTLYAINGGSGLANSAWPMYRKDAKHTGAASNPVLSQMDLGLAMYPGITIKGNVATSYRIDYSTDASNTNNWQFLAAVTLDRTPFLFIDVNAGNSTQRFYRAVLVP